MVINILFICITNATFCMENVNVYDLLLLEQRKEQDCVHSVQAEEYNQNNLLFHLPKDVSDQIFSYCLVPKDQWAALEDNIKNFMRLRLICKNFNRCLTDETIGNFCKSYLPRIKDCLLWRLSMDDTYNCSCVTGEKGNCPALILISAGAIIFDTTDQLYDAVIHKNVLRVAALLKHYTNPNLKYYGAPIFFFAKTVEVAQLFIDNGADIHAVDDYGANVLWTIALDRKYSSQLMELYLKHGVDAKKLQYNACLLHELTSSHHFRTIEQVEDFLQKGKLLLGVMADMVNTLDDCLKTVIDRAQKSSQECPEFNAYEKLIALFREFGGKSACELQQPLCTPKKPSKSKRKLENCIIS